jgi:hypothetical protein
MPLEAVIQSNPTIGARLDARTHAFRFQERVMHIQGLDIPFSRKRNAKTVGDMFSTFRFQERVMCMICA